MFQLLVKALRHMVFIWCKNCCTLAISNIGRTNEMWALKLDIPDERVPVLVNEFAVCVFQVVTAWFVLYPRQRVMKHSL
ncbi:hypothetical protein BX661DRAFT_190181, partial [Kickxella alabastrina]|uniref:uncharacterized protein n=1 Tax=Kickxella alabastrina TaxID=61397 RepID=UPI00221E97DC